MSYSTKKRRHQDWPELRIPSTHHEDVSACLWHTYAMDNPIRFASKKFLQYKNEKCSFKAVVM
jgi:hypothetical protein